MPKHIRLKHSRFGCPNGHRVEWVEAGVLEVGVDIADSVAHDFLRRGAAIWVDASGDPLYPPSIMEQAYDINTERQLAAYKIAVQQFLEAIR